MRPLVVALAAAFAVAGLAACSSSTAKGPAVAVVSTDSECRVATTSVPAGNRAFEVSNKGSKVTEVYVYAPGDKVVAEKENVGPGLTARFTAKLSAGSYQVACKPGQTGSGIRQTITVS